MTASTKILPGSIYRTDEDLYALYNYNDPVQAALRKAQLTVFRNFLDTLLRHEKYNFLLDRYGVVGVTLEGSSSAVEQSGREKFNSRRGVGDLDISVRGNSNYFWLRDFKGKNEDRKKFINDAREAIRLLLFEAATCAGMEISEIKREHLPSDWGDCFDKSKLRFFNLRTKFSREIIQNMLQTPEKYNLDEHDVRVLQKSGPTMVNLFVDYKDIFPFSLLPVTDSITGRKIDLDGNTREIHGVMSIDPRDLAAQKILGLFNHDRHYKWTDLWDLKGLVDCGAVNLLDPVLRKTVIANMVILQPKGYSVGDIDTSIIAPTTENAEKVMAAINSWVPSDCDISVKGAMKLLEFANDLVSKVLGDRRRGKKTDQATVVFKDSEIDFIESVHSSASRTLKPNGPSLIRDFSSMCVLCKCENARACGRIPQAKGLARSVTRHTGADYIVKNLGRVQEAFNGATLCDL